MRYKNLANKTLAAVCMLFVLAVAIKYFYKGMLAADLFYAVATAALVGGIADWFAVTALFRKPLGFPWHTALIPRHRERVIREIATMVEQELLNAEYIKQRLQHFNLVQSVITWADSPSGRRLLNMLLIRHMENYLQDTDANSRSKAIESYVKLAARKFRLSPQLIEWGRWCIQTGKDKALMDFVGRELIRILEKPGTRDEIYRYLAAVKQRSAASAIEKFVVWLGEQTDSVNLDDAADVLHANLLELAKQFQNPEHEIRQWMHVALEDMICSLNDRPKWQQAVDMWKNTIVEKFELQEIITGLLRYNLESPQGTSHSPLFIWLQHYVSLYWEQFKQNEELQEWLEARVKQAIFKIIDSEYRFVGIVVEEILQTFTNEDLSRFIEDKAGDDLQWIRINGSVVGAIVGMIAFLFLHYIYTPYIPVLFRWMNI